MALQERQAPEKRREPAQTPGPTRDRLTLALGLSVLALVCALLGAVGPAKHLQTRFSWPPHDLPALKPERLWYTPLLVSRLQPESIVATVPCVLPPALPHADKPIAVLATARDPASSGALAVVRTGDRLSVRVGAGELGTARVPSQSSAAGCAYRLRFGSGQWALDGGPDNVSTGGSLERMPEVVGLFSGLDLRRGAPPSIAVTTAVHGTETRIHQTILWMVAALAALAGLIALANPKRPRLPNGALGAAARRTFAAAGLADVVVAVVLLLWWFVGPAFFDDGWVVARQRNFSASDGFSAYYSSFGVNLPLDYWLEWLQHWLVTSSRALLVLRIPALLCLAATWILCRRLLARTARSTGNGATRWALVCGFAACALAWGMTLRPEPELAVLVTGVLACAVSFTERERAAPLALAAVLIVLSLSAHPAGIVAVAPLLAAAPALARWARAHAKAGAIVLTSAVALFVVLATVGADLHQRRADTSSLRTFGEETAGWRDEISRYSFLSQAPYGTPLRRVSVALLILAVLAYVLRRRRARPDALLGLPALSLGIALVLLIATPTKWPWHFGALIGLGAVAVAAETARLRSDARESRGWDVRPFLVLATAVAAAAWAWGLRNDWGDLDLRTLHWTLGVERRLTLAKLAGALPVAVLVVLALVELRRSRGRRVPETPWRAAAWTVSLVTVPLIAFTTAVLVADAAKTKSWTLTRQNVDTLRGNLGCGLADDALVPSRSSVRALPVVGSASLASAPAWLPPAPVRGLPRFALGPPSGGSAGAHSPWFELPQGRRVGFFLSDIPSPGQSLELEWGRRQRATIEPVGAVAVAGDAATDARPDIPYWRFYSAGKMQPPSGVSAVRLSVHAKGVPGAAVGLTAPVSYEDEQLTKLLEREAPALALPNLLTYLPCVDQPRVSATAEVPHVIVAFRDSMWPLGTGTSPFDGLPDLYRLIRLPLSDSPDPPGEVAVYEVDRRLEGAAVAPPVFGPAS